MVRPASFFGHVRLRDELLARIGRHEAAGTIDQGFGFVTGGQQFSHYNFVGCALLEPREGPHLADWVEDAWYEQVVSLFGLPRWLVRLASEAFDGLPREAARQWPRKLIEAIPVGVNLDPILHHLLVWFMLDQRSRVRHDQALPSDHVSITERVLALLRLQVAGSVIAETTAQAIVDAAEQHSHVAYAVAYVARKFDRTITVVEDDLCAAVIAHGAFAGVARSSSSADDRHQFWSSSSNELVRLLGVFSADGKRPAA